MKDSRRLGVGLYGKNGHQIHSLLANHPRAELVATAAFDPAALSASQQQNPQIRHGQSLADLLQDKRVELVSLCSPRRCDQARDAIRCLEAGKHVRKALRADGRGVGRDPGCGPKNGLPVP